MTKEIKVSIRNAKSDRKVLKDYNAIPGVVYGTGKEPVSIFVNQSDFIKVFKAAGHSEQVTVEMDGKRVPTLIHDLQFDPVKGLPTHVDFLIVDATHAIKVTVPVHFTGEPKAPKATTTLVKVLHEIEVEALLSDLPKEITVDLSKLENSGDVITVGDLNISSKVKVHADSDEVVATVTPLIEEKETTDTIDFSSIEVAGKKEEVEDNNEA